MEKTDKRRRLDPQRISRREFLNLSGAAAIVFASAGTAGLLTPRLARAVTTNARIVVVGAGAAGLSICSRLSRELAGARITVIDGRTEHCYQPGLTLIATGAWNTAKVSSSNSAYLPAGVRWVQDMVTEYDPDANRVVTVGGEAIPYDYLVVASGLKVDYSAIEGMDTALIGSDGLGCVYDNPANAAGTWQAIERFRQQGGIGLFTRAPGAIKCAGAPLKVAMLTEHRLRQAGSRDRARLHYLAPGDSLFSQPQTNEFLKSYLPQKRGFNMDYGHTLKAIEPGAKRATFATAAGLRTLKYDFIHVVPPMSAPDALAHSPLAWREGPFADGGWLEVDKHSLRHPRYPNVFGIGDVVGTPIGKTAASVKAQAPVVVGNLLQVLQGQDPAYQYNGYTSCPLITEFGQAILVEFDYELNMVPSFGFIDPTREHWVPWVLKDQMLQAAYNAMLRGRV